MILWGVTGWSDAGKTTLIERLIAGLAQRGLRVATLKHTHHDVDPEPERADSRRHRAAGAAQVLLAGPRRWSLVAEHATAAAPALAELVARLDPVDVVLAEGWRDGDHPKIEVWRPETGQPPRAPGDRTIRAMVAQARPKGIDLPVFRPGETEALIAFLTGDAARPWRPAEGAAPAVQAPWPPNLPSARPASSPRGDAPRDPAPDPGRNADLPAVRWDPGGIFAERSQGFDSFVVIDWSAAATPSPRRPAKDAIWAGVADAEADADADADTPGEVYLRTRDAAMTWIETRIAAERSAGRRMLLGLDACLGWPAGFARHLTGQDCAPAVWDWLAHRVEDAPDNANNRFEVAAAINAMFPGTGPFWGRPAGRDLPDLPAHGSARQGHGLPERRRWEGGGMQSVWKLYTTGAVGSQSLLAQARLAGLRARLGADLAVWPFDPPAAVAQAPVVLAEVWPSLAARAVARAARGDEPRDATQVRVTAAVMREMQRRGTLAPALSAAGGAALAEEGWCLGVGVEPAWRAVAGDLWPPSG
ncbi:molybdopterin-guanine dinucleotide biosynthesis protein B [Mesobaculum littorinae]|uniref:Molybdopterin-guanine dinucleotide biosynthesis protein B n=1 Tax=Mesobaculum littorinae TaxID=2486419 RepID=A0A438AGH2_9RHOB|nr:molybdopterin-guanine dinucleotide biosynthesis protein B [Mesobaculum littorinae]RVV97813.1 molybdopterin-guanine dinucleotide biosynthesis protein B [Mesobaculum littorinae]